MTYKSLKTSAKMAIVMGIFLPIAETVRRINQKLDYREFFSWLSNSAEDYFYFLARFYLYEKAISIF